MRLLPLLLLPAFASASAASEPTVAEVQVAVCEKAEGIAAKLTLAVADSSESTAYYFETRALGLRALGMTASSTAKASGKEKVKVKRNFPDAASVDAAEVARWRASCEYDVHPGAEKVGCRSSELSWATAALSGSRLERWGPAVKRSWDLAGGLSVGELETPSGSRAAEVSRRVPAGGRAVALRDLEALLRRAGVSVCPDQSSRYERILDELMR